MQQAFNPNIFPFSAYAIIDPGAQAYYAGPADDTNLWFVDGPSIVPIKDLKSSSDDAARKNATPPPRQNTFSAEKEPGTTVLDSVFDAGRRQEKVTRNSSSTHLRRVGVSDAEWPGLSARNTGKNILNYSLHSFSNITALRELQQHDHFLGRVYSHLLSDELRNQKKKR